MSLPQLRAFSLPPPRLASALDRLASGSVLLAGLLEASSRRRDVREVRAQIVLLLLSLRCPLRGSPARNWYVPGAVARLGAEGLVRAWRGFFNQDAPCLRSVRSHLGALEQSGILQRSPGDWMPVRRDPAHPERRPRWPDTLHILDGEAATEFWSGPGARLLALHPAARRSPDAWRRLFAGWRSGAVQHVLALAGLAVSPARAAVAPEVRTAQRARGEGLARAMARARGPLAVLEGLEAAGARLRGGAAFRAAGHHERLRGAGSMLARALARGDRVRNPAGWVWRAFEQATRIELAAALAWAQEQGPAPGAAGCGNQLGRDFEVAP